MKLVVLDGFTMNPGDLSWQELGSLGELVVYDRTAPEDVLTRSRDAEIILTNKTILDAEIMQNLPRLRFICVLATGFNVVDIDAARKHGVIVSNVPAYGTDSVVQFVFAHILNITCRVADHSASVKNGRWAQSPDFSYQLYPITEISGLTMGISGFGRIGKSVAAAACAFGMNVIVHTRTKPAQPPKYVRFVGLEELFSQSDILSLHCPLTEQTGKIVNQKTLALMKPSAIIINTGRGGLIDEQALADALNSGTIAAAGLDVLSTEPPAPDNPLPGAKNCFITPHIAWSTGAARQRLMNTVVENCRAFIAGKPHNTVNL